MTKRQPSPKSSSKPFDQGLVQIFTGDGKGKTSAALGVALRALGHNLRVYIIYLMKGGYPYGEQQILSQLPNISFSIFGLKSFCDPTNVRPEEKKEAQKALEKAREVIFSGSYDVVILDEINVATAWKLLEVGEVVALVKSKPKNVELILTGRHADPSLIDLADLVTVMANVKHPYDRGVPARKGIDW